jgi:hypothetical protein
MKYETKSSRHSLRKEIYFIPYKSKTMDAKVTLSFDQSAIENAKNFAEKHNISLSRLTEFLYKRLDVNTYSSLEDLPISEWVGMVAEGEAAYKTKSRSRKELRNEFMHSRK